MGDGGFAKYSYNPQTRGLRVERTGYPRPYDVNLDTETKHDDDVFYNSVKFIFDVFAVSEYEKDRTFRYYFTHYQEYKMGDYFGYFGDLLIIHGVKTDTYFMATNRRFFVFSAKAVEDNGLSWFQNLITGGGRSGTISISSITLSFSMHDNLPKWVSYSG